MVWILCALLYSVFRAGFAEVKRHYPLDRWQMAFLQALFGFLLMLPLASFMVWPGDTRFYMGAAGIAVIFSVGMVIQLGLADRKSGRVSSLYMPVEAVAAIVIWDAIHGRLPLDYFVFPVIGISLTVIFAVAMGALLKMRTHDITWHSFLIVLPVALTYAVGGVITKILLGAYFLSGLMLTFVLLYFAVMALITGAALLVGKKADSSLVAANTLRGGLFTALLTAPSMMAFVTGIALAPNPGFVSFIGMLLPVWLLLLHRLRRVEDDSNFMAAVVLTACIVLFTLISLQLNL